MGNRSRRFLLLTGVIVSGLVAYSALIEPYLLLVNRIAVPAPELPSNWDGATVVQLSDAHLGYPSPAAWRAVEAVRGEHPDLVVVTGDIADKRSSISVVLAWAKQLCDAAGVPVVYVAGNHEHWRFGDREAMGQFLDQLRQTGVVVLENESTRISRRSGGSPIVIVGLDDSYSHYMDVEAGFSALAAGERAIVLEHCPDDVTDIVASGQASLVLTGHTHGGQVRFPLYGNRLAAFLQGSPFVRGLYQVDDVPLYVSSGLGMSILPVRFFCPPEVTVFTLSRP